jgi:hypothetical protein
MVDRDWERADVWDPPESERRGVAKRSEASSQEGPYVDEEVEVR